MKLIPVMFFMPVLDGGGAEMNAVRLASCLRSEGIEPLFVVARGGGGYAESLPLDVEVVVLNTGQIGSSTLRIVRSLRPLVRVIDDKQPEIVVPIMPLPCLLALAAVRRSRHKPHVVLSIQCTLEAPRSLRFGLVDRVVNGLIGRMFPRADRVIALSEGVAADVARAVPALQNKIEVVYNVGLPLESQLSAVHSERIAPLDQGLRFVACGRLTEQKGYRFLLHAFARVAHEIDAELHILGAGPLRPELENLAKRLGIMRRVSFLGFRKNPLVHMQAADVFVLSSLYEGFGNVIVEAMAMGTPVIATRCPHGPDEIITDGESGLLVPPADVGALAQAMLRLARDPGLRARLAAAGQARAQEFSAERIAGEFAAVLRKLVSPSPHEQPMNAADEDANIPTAAKNGRPVMGPATR